MCRRSRSAERIATETGPIVTLIRNAWVAGQIHAAATYQSLMRWSSSMVAWFPLDGNPTRRIINGGELSGCWARALVQMGFEGGGDLGEGRGATAAEGVHQSEGVGH